MTPELTAPRTPSVNLAWFQRGGHWLLISFAQRRHAPVVVFSIWADNRWGKRFPVPGAQFEMGVFQLPELGRAIAKAISWAHDGVSP